MPSVPIYIRQEDWSKWDSIKDKPAFIHNALNVREAYRDLEPEQKVVVKKVIKNVRDATQAVEAIPKDNNWSGPLWKKDKK